MTTLDEPGRDGGGLTVPRPRLEARLDDALGKRLTTLIAGAGSGKTTLLRQWAEPQSVAWHLVSPKDSAWTTLARAVLDAVRLRIPGLSQDLVYAIEGGGGNDSDSDEEARAETYASLLCQELAQELTERHLVLVLDDLHEVGSSAASARFVAGMCRNAPDRFHVVVGSRRPVPFSTVRLAMEGHVLDIAAGELAMTEEEVEDLLAQVLDDEARVLAAGVSARTAGWAAATRLAAEAMRASQARSIDDVIPAAIREPLFDYLAEEVLGQESDSDREMLAAIAELPWVTAELCAKVLPGDGPAALENLMRRGVYFADSEHQRGAIRLTPVMREFILTNAPMEDRADLLTEAGRWYESAGFDGDAMRCFASAGAHDELARMMRRRGRSMFASASAGDVITMCQLIPADHVDDAITMLLGEAYQVTGDWEAALDHYRKVIPSSGPIRAAMAWRIGLLHHLKGELDHAFVAYERGVVDGSDLSSEAILLGWNASAHWLRGNRDRCEALAVQALDCARLSQDSNALAAAHTAMALVAAMDADRSANDAHYLKALEHAQRAGDALQATRIRVNRGSRSLEEGRFAEALEELDVALRLADLAGFASFRALALSNRGQTLLHLGRLEEAIKDLEEARAIYRRAGSRLESYPLSHLGDVYRLRGDRAMARAAYEQAHGLAEAEGDLQALVPSLSGMAMLTVDEDPEEATRLAEAAVANSAVLGHVGALVAAGRVAIARHDLETAGRLAARAAEVARQRRDLPGLAEALLLEALSIGGADGLARLDEAERIWRQVGAPLHPALAGLERARMVPSSEAADVARTSAIRLRRLGALGAAAEAERIAGETDGTHLGGLGIRTLGGFAVVRPTGPVSNAEWQSKKARDLLKILIAGHGKPVHREVLIDRLWPDEDPARASGRLSVALSTVRGVLDPDKSRAADHYVAADREAIVLVSGNVTVDVAEFIATAERGLRAWSAGDHLAGRALMEAAEAMYVGDFLEEDLYEDWAVPTREQSRNLCLRIQGVLAEACREEGDHETAGRLYLRMLERDPYHEDAHLGLVASMAALRRHGAARRAYRIYVARMQELELEPAPFPADGAASA